MTTYYSVVGTPFEAGSLHHEVDGPYTVQEVCGMARRASVHPWTFTPYSPVIYRADGQPYKLNDTAADTFRQVVIDDAVEAAHTFIGRRYRRGGSAAAMRHVKDNPTKDTCVRASLMRSLCLGGHVDDIGIIRAERAARAARRYKGLSAVEYDKHWRKQQAAVYKSVTMKYTRIFFELAEPLS